jgi:cytochrome P450
MDATPKPFVPPAPIPRTKPIGTFDLLRTAYRNPLEIWGEPSFSEPFITVKTFGVPTMIASEPGLVRHILVDNAKNYVMAPIRQRILRPILRDGLLTAEGEVWKRSRKAMAPVFTPKHIFGFAPAMLQSTMEFLERYQKPDGKPVDMAHEMTLLTYDILARTLFSGEIAGQAGDFAAQVEKLFETMGRVDPLDLIGAPAFLPRFNRIRGRKALAFFRKIVTDTVELRKAKMAQKGAEAPNDFLTLLLKVEGPQGLSREEIEDNIITFIGAGHETTARALGWTLYLLSQAPEERAKVEAEIDAAWETLGQPDTWLDKLPMTRAALDEAMRLYPPAPALHRMAIDDDAFGSMKIKKGTVCVMLPWLIHRHNKLWDEPNAFKPSRFHPGNREKLDRFQYIPFGLGPRICIGMSFAMQEGVIALACLLRRHRFDLIDGFQPWPVQKLTTQPQGGLPMFVTPRAV